MAVRRRRGFGLLPRLGGAMWSGAKWLVRRPQILVGLALAIAVSVAVCRFAIHSDAFRIVHIRAPADCPVRVSPLLMGQNLWAVDLGALATQLHAQQTHLMQVQVIRVLPDTLQVEVRTRTAVAQVQVHGPTGGWQWFAVATDGFILPEPSSRPTANLVTLKGVERPQMPLNVGRENTSDRLRHALQLIEHLRRSPTLHGHQLTEVDVGDPSQLTFVIDDGIEIRCGSEEELRTHLDRLRVVLSAIAKRQVPVRYIDVRFKDPVLGPRT